jgi:hypothetical protein
MACEPTSRLRIIKGVAGFLPLDRGGASDADSSDDGDGDDERGFFRSGFGISEAQNEGVMTLGRER